MEEGLQGWLKCQLKCPGGGGEGGGRMHSNAGMGQGRVGSAAVLFWEVT